MHTKLFDRKDIDWRIGGSADWRIGGWGMGDLVNSDMAGPIEYCRSGLGGLDRPIRMCHVHNLILKWYKHL